MDKPEKRKFKRLQIKLDLSCRKIGTADENSYIGRTVNVSPGGLYFQTKADVFEPGSIVKVDLSIPPTEGLLEFGGRISGFAKILRTSAVWDRSKHPTSQAGSYEVALEFCRSPRLCT